MRRKASALTVMPAVTRSQWGLSMRTPSIARKTDIAQTRRKTNGIKSVRPSNRQEVWMEIGDTAGQTKEPQCTSTSGLTSAAGVLARQDLADGRIEGGAAAAHELLLRPVIEPHSEVERQRARDAKIILDVEGFIRRMRHFAPMISSTKSLSIGLAG